MVAPAVSAVAACSLFPRGVDIRSAEATLQEKQIGLEVGACHADLSADVVETPDEVVVEVTARNADQNDCTGYILVELDAPLGSRSLIDGHNDRELFVEGRREDG